MMADNDIKTLLLSKLNKHQIMKKPRKKKMSNDTEVAIMELQKEVEFIKDNQQSAHEENKEQHAEIRQDIKNLKKEVLDVLKENYVTKAYCEKAHLGGQLSQEKKESSLRDKIIGGIFALIFAIIGGVVVYFITH